MLVHFRQPPPQLSSSSLHGGRDKLVSFANLTNPSRTVLSFATHNLHLLHPPKPHKTPRPLLVLASYSGSTPTNTPTAKKTILRPRKADTTPEDTTTTTTTTSRGSTADDSPRRRFEQSSGSPRDGREKKKRKPDGDKKEAFVEAEEDRDRLLDAAEFDLGVSASEYFEKHAIRNVEVDGVEIDWEGEMDNAYVQEINCLEWESFAFHPSPLMVLVFERYNRAADNWMLVKELEKAAKVYLDSRNLLPPRMAKIDINIETDLAYALKVRQCPQLLFLRGDKILYREKELRTADELVQMIAYFYYNAKKPSWVVEASIRHPY